ncbi:hypothetical protein CLAFUW4_09515 [Fulvia fulva]|uniref:Uncharacterized protein n=1 Tax=Passalora fulva TaxID=5499 RepID=A0A9Q8PFX9_PASFU|nr:uncharacterized protein CLAFUR5_09612 [Fulvia fulva]KAK4613249.1 hypothetical protein CLAFUR4_09521 [Fulvia fulva]KAK4614707.1 hypothetical protein CLAFUR0_09512 [Fulvia fulva]UJO21706.1 hypothetical protein CLAFUR5_09612 [Fulvia fulva]WPV20186.1 hypothetical protein CLAFUW4_09515 [Fulvia fulva]WPV34840.1 hypothetical protein CLAFUW7_09516 [Fulvia fulva]
MSLNVLKQSFTEPEVADPDAELIKNIASDLERLSAYSLEVVNLRDWEYQTALGAELKEHLGPDHHVAFVSAHRQSITGAEMVAAFKARIKEFPDYHIIAMDITSDVDVQKCSASVWMHLNIHMTPETMVTGFNEFQWRLEGNKWMCVHVTSMRGQSSDQGIYPKGREHRRGSADSTGSKTSFSTIGSSTTSHTTTSTDSGG